jgi:selenocysteine lyase/cysteine desulfurase
MGDGDISNVLCHSGRVVLKVLTPGEVKLPGGRSVEFANLDIAATAPCLEVVAEKVAELLPWYGSVHRGAGALAERCSREYDQARETIAEFLGCGERDTVIFTRNTTDALNLLAHCLPSGTTVVTFDVEHHANLLPWRDAVRLGVPRSPGAAVKALDAALAGFNGPVLVAVTAASNVTGELWPVAELAEVAHRHGARIAVDIAQLAPHAPVDMRALGADYVAMSGHKLYAPFGAGVLAGRQDWLDAAVPYLAGGGATANVSEQLAVSWHTGPARHEAGTPNLLGAVALAAACEALATADNSEEQALVTRLRAAIAARPDAEELRLFDADAPRVGIVSFVLLGAEPDEAGAALGHEHGIGVRVGLFCAHPLTRRLIREAADRLDPAATPPGAAIRASFGHGTRPEHVQRLIDFLEDPRC